MTTLTEDQVQLVREYTTMLQNVDEAFEYVVASFSDYSKTEGDLVLSDILSSFVQLIQVNDDLTTIFHENMEVKKSILGFNEVIAAAEKLDGIFEKSQEKQEVIQQSLYPAYKKWFDSIHPQLVVYTQI
ncbi:hypothetical protein KD050_16085 [Psychrobacillus sp. INOP01]|uniref:hypothetical protein n=1 Tax=Psychrobacillus sp. INOP01 TaxID=2829187 RepID=UPI001BA472EE|nr:hypothetical protein [Psychrobacillus sp. INOP01]QUG40799.1 hypothetical protein KD050_16085 [Psychrobacillus sp. INOP01]